MSGTTVDKIELALDDLSTTDKEKLTQTATKVMKEDLTSKDSDLPTVIKMLSNSILYADDIFFLIEKKLGVVSISDQSSESLRKDAERLLSTWKGHHSAFVKLMWRSRDVAGMAESAAKDFSKSILVFLMLPKERVGTETKLAYADKYVLKLTQQEADGLDLTDSIIELQKNIKYFQADWDEIAELNEKITYAKKASVHEGIARMGISGFFARVIPDYFSSLIGKIFGEAKAVNQKIPDLKPLIDRQRQIGAELHQAIAELDRQDPDWDTIKRIDVALKSLTSSHLPTAADKISTFFTVWTLIKQEIGVIRNTLTSGDDEGSGEPLPLLHIPVEKIAAEYAVLSKALELYATTIEPPKLL